MRMFQWTKFMLACGLHLHVHVHISPHAVELEAFGDISHSTVAAGELKVSCAALA